MLGISKPSKKDSDLDDLLGNVAVDSKKKEKKKNQGFFDDL